MLVLKTLKKDAALKASEVLSGIEGLMVLPITEFVLTKPRFLERGRR